MTKLSVLVFMLLIVIETKAESPLEEFRDKLKPVVNKCIESTGVDKEIVQQFNDGNMVNDAKLKCYMKCIFLELDFINPTTGFFHYERMLNFLPDEIKIIAYDMGRNCVHFKGEGGSDLCQVSYDLHRCWQKSDPKHYFLI